MSRSPKVRIDARELAARWGGGQRPNGKHNGAVVWGCPCPIHGGKSRDSLHLWDYDSGWLGISCKGGCSKETLLALARAQGWEPPGDCPTARPPAAGSGARPLGRGVSTPNPKQGPLRGSSKGRNGDYEARRRAYAVRVWAVAAPIPQAPTHPARRWLAARNLWWPGVPLPAAMRFVEALPRPDWPYGGQPPTSAAIVALLAQPDAWLAAWPQLPTPDAVHCVFVGPDGGKVPPNKRTYGLLQGTAVVIGSPLPAADGLSVVEGLADGLGRTARHWETTICTATTPPLEGAVSEYAAAWQRVAVLSDNDGAGDKTGFQFLGRLLGRGVDARRLVYDGFKDPAEAYAAGVEPLADVQSRRADVREIADGFEAGGLPRWEAVRRAALCIVDESDIDKLDTMEGAPPNSGDAHGSPTQGQPLPSGTVGH